MSESRRSKLSAVKVIGIVLGGLVMLGVALVTFAILRPSLPFLLGEDIESFAVIGRNDAKVCGTPVSTLGAPNHQAGSSDLGSPRVQVLSWRLIYPLEGAASVRITGTGFQKAPDYEASTGNCEATLTFKYRASWGYNGRRMELNREFLQRPTTVRHSAAERTRQAASPPPQAYFANIRDALKRGGLILPDMAEIPAGKFRMGANTAYGFAPTQPEHTVTIKRFALARHEVTFEAYEQFVADTSAQPPSDEGTGPGKRPVTNVSWQDAQAYAKWLSGKTGKRYRLPTEAEWEYAARTGDKQEIWAGANSQDALEHHAWFDKNSHGETQVVGKKNPNGFGLFDMSGNVAEWVEDCWHEYVAAPRDGRAWAGECGDQTFHVIRGGSWKHLPVALRTTTRDGAREGERFPTVGFRLAQDLP